MVVGPWPIPEKGLIVCSNQASLEVHEKNNQFNNQKIQTNISHYGDKKCVLAKCIPALTSDSQTSALVPN